MLAIEGLAPILVRDLYRVVQLLKAEGLSVLLVEQNLTFAFELADYIYVMSKGRIVYESYPKEVQQNDEIKHRYLGV